MSFKSYQDLEVWQKVMNLVVLCYQRAKDFPKNELYGLTSQLRRAAVSIPVNIAEGRARQYTKEFLQHLSIAYGSTAEVETLVLIAERLKYIDTNKSQEVMRETSEVGRIINGLKKSLKGKT